MTMRQPTIVADRRHFCKVELSSFLSRTARRATGAGKATARALMPTAQNIKQDESWGQTLTVKE
jgi:hypothetical protein